MKQPLFVARSFCVYATFLCGAERVLGVVFGSARPFFLFKIARVVAWLSVGTLTAEYKRNVCNRMSCSYKGGKLRLNIALFV